MRVGGGRSVGGQTREYPRDGRASTRALVALGMVVLVGMAALAGPGGLTGSVSAGLAGGNVPDCQTIDRSGVYEIHDDIDATGGGPCIIIAADSVVLDGNGNTISPVEGGLAGISIGQDEATVSDVTVRDVTVSGFATGIDVDSAEDISLQDIQVRDASSDGVSVRSADRVTVSGTSIEDVSGEGTTYGLNAENVFGITLSDVSIANADVGIALDSIGDGTVEASTVRNVGEEGIHVMWATDGFETEEPEALPTASLEIVGTTVENAGHDSGELPADGIRAEFSYVDIRDTEVLDAAGNGISLTPAVSRIENVQVSGSGKHGVTAPTMASSIVVIQGTETRITNNGGHGVNIEDACFDENCRMSIEDATVANNGERDIRAASPEPVHLTNVNLGASTASDTSIDAELYASSVAGVDAAPDAPGGLGELGRYVDVMAESVDHEDGEGTPTGTPTAIAVAESMQEGSQGSYANLTLHYASSDVDGLQESTVALHRHDGGAWSEVASGTSANVTAFGTFGLFAQPEPTPTPAPTEEPSGDDDTPAPEPAFRIGDVNVDDEVEPGEQTTVTVVVENDGDGDGTNNATLSSDDGVIDSRNVFVRAGENRTVRFSVSFDAEGEYDLGISDQTTVTVTVASQDESTVAPTPTDTATPTDTETPTDDSGGAPTPEEDDGGPGPLVFVLVGVVALLAIGGTAYWMQTQ